MGVSGPNNCGRLPTCGSMPGSNLGLDHRLETAGWLRSRLPGVRSDVPLQIVGEEGHQERDRYIEPSCGRKVRAERAGHLSSAGVAGAGDVSVGDHVCLSEISPGPNH